MQVTLISAHLFVVGISNEIMGILYVLGVKSKKPEFKTVLNTNSMGASRYLSFLDSYVSYILDFRP